MRRTNGTSETGLATDVARHCAFAARYWALSHDLDDEDQFDTAAVLAECAALIDPSTPDDQRAFLAMKWAMMQAAPICARAARVVAAVLSEKERAESLPDGLPDGTAGTVLAAAAFIEAAEPGPATWVVHNPQDWADAIVDYLSGEECS